MSKAFAASLAGLGTAATGGGIYLASKNLPSSEEKNTILLKLQNDRYTLLKSNDSNHQDHWKTSKEKYISSHSDKSSYTEKDLKDLCTSLLGKKDSELEAYNEARKYCVVPNTISQRLTALGLRPLKTGESEDTEKWKKLSVEYKKGGENFKKLNDLEHSTINDETTTGQSLRNKCKDVFAKDHWIENYDTLLDSSKDWCTEEGVSRITPAAK
ncbi:hypothetical protein HF1_09080 [Mycoplasma haemofelis str. Langford 1]|uniref:Uncharacterized protein n=1 Tax=Mycoplasma haemofelis (strain Langford 1) TaxID=941640 RepID=E8ZIE5_MYCHL|nr:hypothetical protein [Mycoplasma haemofelis]CBY92916.1 hypothetical protein HF1_09080 [Mycoplasma haemofelis str. Langford 1]